MSASLATVYPSQGQSYYAKDNYYSKEGSSEITEWWGKGAEALNLNGSVETADFQAVLEMRDPQTGERLPGYQMKNLTDGRKPRAGFDITYAPPKSCSYQALVLGDTRVIDAFREAVDRDLGRLESHYSMTRIQKDGKRSLEPTGNLVVAKFFHDTNRRLEPLLHMHCVVSGATPCADGKWRAVYTDPVWASSGERNRMFMADLERGLNARGVETVKSPDNGAFEIRGYSREQVESMSTMSARVEALRYFDPPVSARIAVDAEGDRRVKAAHFAAVRGAIDELTENGLLRNPAACQEAYLRALRHELVDRKISLRELPNGSFELARYTKFEVASYAANRQHSSILVATKAQERVAKMETRPAKSLVEEREALYGGWLERGMQQGLAYPLDLIKAQASTTLRKEQGELAKVIDLETWKSQRTGPVGNLVAEFANETRRALLGETAPNSVRTIAAMLSERANEISPRDVRNYAALRDLAQVEASIRKMEGGGAGPALAALAVDRIAITTALAAPHASRAEITAMVHKERNTEEAPMKGRLAEKLAGLRQEADLSARPQNEDQALAQLAKERAEASTYGFSLVTREDLKAMAAEAAAQAQPKAKEAEGSFERIDRAVGNAYDSVKETVSNAWEGIKEDWTTAVNRSEALQDLADHQARESPYGMALATERELDQNLHTQVLEADRELSALRYENYQPIESKENLSPQERNNILQWDDKMAKMQEGFEKLDLGKLDPKEVENLSAQVRELKTEYAKANEDTKEATSEPAHTAHKEREHEHEMGED